MSVEQSDTITLDDLSTFLANPIVTWSWYVGNDTLNIVNNSSNQYFATDMSGNYTITLMVEDNLGCQDEFSLMVTVNDPVLVVPNVVTPNGDGINDELVFSEVYFKTYSVEIFNRWGHLIYTIKDQTGMAIWDADTQNGTPVTDGVYFYRIVGEMLAGTKVDSHGFVTVIGSK
jgi:gliding motility-associated-like protein